MCVCVVFAQLCTLQCERVERCKRDRSHQGHQPHQPMMLQAWHTGATSILVDALAMAALLVGFICARGSVAPCAQAHSTRALPPPHPSVPAQQLPAQKCAPAVWAARLLRWWAKRSAAVQQGCLVGMRGRRRRGGGRAGRGGKQGCLKARVPRHSSPYIWALHHIYDDAVWAGATQEAEHGLHPPVEHPPSATLSSSARNPPILFASALRWKAWHRGGVTQHQMKEGGGTCRCYLMGPFTSLQPTLCCRQHAGEQPSMSRQVKVDAHTTWVVGLWG